MKKIFLLFAVAAFLIAGCNTSGEKTGNETESPAAKINPEKLVRFDLDVSGMTCTGCEQTIETGVSELAGISEVKASHMEATAYVVADTSLTSIDEIKGAIESKGYKVVDSKIHSGEMPDDTEEISE